jgi:HEAT repeat protein
MVSRDGQDADQAHEVAPEEAAATRSAAAWVTQLARTLKTCRLYDANNPTVVRFREELGLALKAQVETYGPLVLRFTGSEVFCGERLLYEARSREDNLAAPFFRDGIRTLTFAEGIEPAEAATFLDQVLRVTARGADEEDLVTLLWDAQLVHLDMTYVSAQADGDEEETRQGGSANATSSPAPWPKDAAATGTGRSGSGGAPPEESPEAADPEVRSDDWVAGHAVGDLERAWHDLEASAPAEVLRFNRQQAAEREVPNITAAVRLIGDCMDSGVTALDRDILATYLPRLLREAIGIGDWEDAQAALALLTRCESNAWSLEATAADLATPGNPITTAALRRLDQQPMAVVQQFLTLARELGPSAIEWLMFLVAESDQQRVRRPLLRVVAELCKDNPERLAPWLTDDRWYVVRNGVHILGLIGGPAILGLLRAVARHPEPRVRQEVVASLANAGVATAHELLVEMLPGADTRIFCSVLHQLASERSPEIARLMLGFLVAPEFAERPVEECRAIYRTLGSTGDDETVTGLEAELLRTKWFSQGHEQHRQSVARCIARIGTPLARQVLERAAQSKNAAVRKAAQEASGGGSPND